MEICSPAKQNCDTIRNAIYTRMSYHCILSNICTTLLFLPTTRKVTLDRLALILHRSILKECLIRQLLNRLVKRVDHDFCAYVLVQCPAINAGFLVLECIV